VKSVPRVGVLLLNEQLRPLHYNSEAAHILQYPGKARTIPSIDARLPASRFRPGASEPATPVVSWFTSGRRRYVCRAFHLDVTGGADHRSQPQVLLVLEREHRTDTANWNELFQLSNRECETVELLLKGLTSKEIATLMQISPHTVKAFLKLAMAKVGASNRTELIARILQKAS
jgi:DNA-binding CsgD family transcriptional regulator